jgi:hypothetical protein
MNGNTFIGSQSINYGSQSINSGYNERSEVISTDHTLDLFDTGFAYDAIGNRLKYSEGTTTI